MRIIDGCSHWRLRQKRYCCRHPERCGRADKMRWRAYDAARRQRDKLKIKARNAVSNAVHSGKLVRQPCEVCGTLPSEAHHDDYTKPLSVRWFCVEHHDELHRLK